MPRPKRPHISKRLNHGAIRYVVDLGMIDGKRIEKFFPTKSAAETFLAEQKEKLSRHGWSAVSLTEDERVLFQAARDRLARMGATISQAVDYFAANHRELREALTLQELIARCVTDKELTGSFR